MGVQRWLLPYADVVTLLFALFAYQYFLGRAGPPKLESPTPTATPALAALPAKSVSVARPDRNAQMAQQVSAALVGFDGKLFQIYRDDRGVILVLADSPLLFASASSSLAPAGEQLLSRVVPVLQKARASLRIEGHADNQPLHHPFYRDNWELSIGRAATVAHSLIKLGVQPDQLSLVGFGDRRPVQSNETAQGRSRNRRVELVFQFAPPVEDGTVSESPSPPSQSATPVAQD